MNKVVMVKRRVPLMGRSESVPSCTLRPGILTTLGPEHHEGKHFQSLVRSGMLRVIREEEPAPPKPTKIPSSTPRRSAKKKAAPKSPELKPEPKPEPSITSPAAGDGSEE